MKVTQGHRDAILKNYDKSSISQLAKFVSLSKTQVVREVRKLKDAGKLPEARKRYSNPCIVGKHVILVAKTCTACGNLLPADWFYRNAAGYWSHECKKCENIRITHGNNGEKTQDRYFKTREYLSIMRRITLPLANRNGQELTDEDHKILSNTSMTNLQKALELGRTYDAVGTAVHRFGYGSKRKRLPDPNVDVWIIRFPQALKMLQKQFIRLGVLDDGWDHVA